MSETVRIGVEERSDPQLRKLARALLSLASRQQTNQRGRQLSTPTSAASSPGSWSDRVSLEARS
jgi:hypothetical protein